MARQTARERADAFLKIAPDFHLGELVTESSHPRTADLSDVRATAPRPGLAAFFDVDRDVVSRSASGRRSGQPARMATPPPRRSGRPPPVPHGLRCDRAAQYPTRLDLAMFLAGPPHAGADTPAPGIWENRTRSVMAGGDYALIKSVEGFEDFAPFGRKQIATWRGERRRGLRHHRRRRNLVRHRHGVAGARRRRPRLLRLQQSRCRVACARAAEPRGARRASHREGQSDDRADGHHRIHADAGDQYRTAGDAHRAGDDAAANCWDAGVLEEGVGPALRGARGDAARPSALHAELASAASSSRSARLVETEERIYRAGGRTSYFATRSPLTC